MLTKVLMLLAFLMPVFSYGKVSSTSELNRNQDKAGRYALSMKGIMSEKDGKLTFLSPAGSAITIPSATVRGKPFLIATYPAGFSPGNDPAIDYQWGVVGNDLTISYTTPAHYENGAYDALFIVYINTPISEEILKGDPMYAPAPVKGDLSSFTIDDSVVLGDDPSLPNGLVRLNVRDGHATITVNNLTPASSSAEDLFKALTNTLLIIP